MIQVQARDAYHNWNDQNNIKKYWNKKKTERYNGRIK